MFESRFPEAIAEARKSIEINGGRRRRLLAELAKCLAAAGQTEEARSVLREVQKGDWPEPEPSYEIAVLYATLGDKDSAFSYLDQAFDRRLTRIIWAKSDPELDVLRADPRFPKLLARLGLGQ